MISFRALRSQINRWFGRHASPPSHKLGTSSPPGLPPITPMPTTLYLYKLRQSDCDSGLGTSRPPTICTPDSTRSVYFEDSISWPYIDEEIDPCD